MGLRPKNFGVWNLANKPLAEIMKCDPKKSGIMGGPGFHKIPL